MRFRIVTLAALAALLAGCGQKKVDAGEFARLSEEFLYSTLALSPVSASASGYHEHKGAKLDEQLDDYSPTGINRSREHFASWDKRVRSIDRAALDAESRADLELIDTQVQLALLEYQTIQDYRHNPTLYVELAGNALFTPYSVEYAPAAQRWAAIIARLKALPQLMQSAQANLVDSNAIWTRVAIEENDGNLEMIEGLLAGKVPAELKAEYDAAAKPAAAALRAYSAHLKTLKDTGADGWRLGKQRYDAKFRLVVGRDVTPEKLLADAEAALTAVRKEMFMTSLPLHVKYYPTHKDPVDVNLIVGETLAKVAQKHVKAGDYFKEAARTLEETRSFLRAHEDRVVKLPGRDNLQLIETPAFMRGVYGVGGFNPAPPLQPELGAFYWLTPIPANWPAERVESKLREYNDYGLRILTIHEAIPGHYVQFEYASRVEPKPRRLLRALFGSGPYVEGWAVYATEIMLKEGYLEHNPEMQLTWGKQLLRAIANTVLDIRMQTMGMTDDEAMKLMVERTFQEKEEATAKLQRAKLGACQLPTYFAGYRGWKQLRAALEKKEGAKFSPQAFHQRALEAGALPLSALSTLLGAEAAPPQP